MTDDEILQIANEVLVPAGILGAQVRRPALNYRQDNATYRALSVIMPAEPPAGENNHFYTGWIEYPETNPTLSPAQVRLNAGELVEFITKQTADGPTPWKPANAEVS